MIFHTCFSLSSQYLSTEQENRKHPQTGLTDSDDFYYIPAMSKNPTLVLKSKDLWFSGGVTLEGHNIQQMVAGRKGGLFINLGHRKRERRESEGEGGRARQLVLQNVNMKQNGRIKRV